MFAKDHNAFLVWVMLGGFVVSFAYALIFRIHPTVDAEAYDNIAQNLVVGNGFVEEAGADPAVDPAIVRVGPLYQYFLAGIYAVFGHRLWVVWLVQALLHAVSAYFVYSTARIAFRAYPFGQWASLLAATIFSFYPDLIEISAKGATGEAKELVPIRIGS